MNIIAMAAAVGFAVAAPNAAYAQNEPVPCALLRNLADTQSAAARALATETEGTAQGRISVDDPNAQEALEALQETSKRAAPLVNELADAWEEYQIATIRCGR